MLLRAAAHHPPDCHPPHCSSRAIAPCGRWPPSGPKKGGARRCVRRRALHARPWPSKLSSPQGKLPYEKVLCCSCRAHYPAYADQPPPTIKKNGEREPPHGGAPPPLLLLPTLALSPPAGPAHAPRPGPLAGQWRAHVRQPPCVRRASKIRLVPPPPAAGCLVGPMSTSSARPTARPNQSRGRAGCRGVCATAALAPPPRLAIVRSPASAATPPIRARRHVRPLSGARPRPPRIHSRRGLRAVCRPPGDGRVC